MANPWETDAPNFRSGGSFPWARTFVGLLVVLSATFVLAYYVPLHRAHETLTALHREVGGKVRAAEEKVVRLEAELSAVTKTRDELQAAAQAREGTHKATGEHLEGLKAALATKLDKAIKKGDAAVGSAGDRVFVAISAKALFAPPKNDVSAQGRALLCDVAKIGERHPLRVAAIGGGGKPTDSAWSATATRAARATEAVEEKCQVPAERLSAVGYATNQPNAKAFEDAKLASERVEIEIVPDAEP
jgi:chemotaxis protein MotB